VEPGEVYFISVWAKKHASYNGSGFSFYVYGFDIDNGHTSASLGTIATTTAWQKYSFTWTVPAGWKSTSLYLYTGAFTDGALYFTNVTMRRANDATLIVDGAITAAKITAGAITTDKLDVVNMVANDGNYLISVGWYLTATSTQYPAPTTANFTADGQTHFYRWSGSAWQEIVNIGHKQESSDHFAMRLFSNSGITQNIYSEVYQDGVGVHGLALTSNNAGVGVKGTNTSSAGYGVCGTNLGGGYAIVAQTHGSAATGAPIVLGASGSASAPSHTALKGSMWVTSAGILYINTDGGTTWAKVGSQ
jgi:hypothetical protein